MSDQGRVLRRQKGSALLITLAFVILLTVLIVGFLSRSLLEQRISSSSANQVKSDLFAQGVEATIIGDLEQEIINGSTSATAGSSTIYTPNKAANMVPMYDYPSCPSGTTGPAATLANLLKVSTTSPVTGSTFPKAASAPTTTVSLNGRSVPLTRWGLSQLVDPSAISGATFPTPNWIMVARDGSAPTAFSNSGATDLTYSSSNKTNARTVIGRYAYTIYDEGGLVDMNVAGQPSTLSGAPAPYSGAASYRSAETFADLIQIGMNSTQIDNLIGWRNNASAQVSASGFQSAFTAVTGPSSPTPTFTAFTWSSANATNYVSNVLNNATGNLSVSNPRVSSVGVSPNTTDQAFTSRYALIQFIQGLYNASFSAANLTSANTALQYMTHFSRALNQPSVIPPVNNPNLTGANVAPTTTAYSSTTSDPATVGTNTANGSDKTINPSFLSIVVPGAVTTPPTAVFKRNDGSVANAGEPLVKKRFDLNRLAWITYKGPLCDGHYTTGIATSAAQVTADLDIQVIANQLHNTYGLSWAFLQQGTAANIYNYFGLSWITDNRNLPIGSPPVFPLGDGQKKWYYYHPKGNTAPYASVQAGGGNILKLSDIADPTFNPNREPDMVELLLAGTTVGSIAKAATFASQNNTATDPSGFIIRPGGPEDYQNTMDSSVNFAIIQMFANIIDQFDLDGYPTRILFYDNSALSKEFIGVENLPYIYRVRNGFVQCMDGVDTDGTSSPQSAGVVTTRGFGVMMQFPELWNPHDQNSPRCAIDPSTNKYLKDHSSNPMFPTQFRVVADSIDPDHIIPTPSVGTLAANIISNYKWNYTVPPVTASNSTPQVSRLQASVYGASNPNGGYAYSKDADASIAYTDGAKSPFANVNEMKSPQTPLFSENTALTFTMDESVTATQAGFFREPTMLILPNYPNGSGLTASDATYGGVYNPLNVNSATPLPGPSFAANFLDGAQINKPFGSPALTYVNSSGVLGSDGKYYLGLFMEVVPIAWYQTNYAVHGDFWDNRNFINYSNSNHQQYATCETSLTYRVQYYNSYDATAGWSTYDLKYGNTGSRSASGVVKAGTLASNLLNTWKCAQAYDPRSARFSMPNSDIVYPPGFAGDINVSWNWLSNLPTGATNPQAVLSTGRPDYNNGYFNGSFTGAQDASLQLPQALGFTSEPQANFGLLDQNDPNFTPSGHVATGKTSQPALNNNVWSGTAAQYYSDPDGVVRRGTAAFFSGAGVVGLPMAIANTVSNGIESASAAQSTLSRAIVLNRPFKSVADLGYVWSGTPWRNIDFNTPESGTASLLDIFTVGDTPDTNGLIAGKVNLNTQQIPVLQAILAGAYRDEQGIVATPGLAPAPSPLATLTSAEATKIATALTARTLATNPKASQGPLQNVSELVSKWVSKQTIGLTTYIDPAKSYAGFSSDFTSGANANDLTSAFAAAGTATSTTNIQRMRESVVRTLASAGQTRVWNLMIDVVAQTGDYPSSATSFDQFAVQGEQRYWIHLAIDRLTGQIIDKQVEVVKE